MISLPPMPDVSALEPIKKYIKPVSFLLTILGGGFFVYALLQVDLSSALKAFPMWSVVAAAVIYGLIMFLPARAWMSLVRAQADNKLGQAHLLITYARSVLTKYLPGNVFQYVSRHSDLTDQGIKQTKIAKANLYEIVSHTISAGIIAGLGFLLFIWHHPLALDGIPIWLQPALLTAILILGILFLAWDKWGITTALRPALPFHIAFLVGTEVLSLYFLNQAAPDTFDVLPFGVFSLAWLAGYVVIGSPGGLGVREATYITLLQPFADIGTLATVILAVRIATIAGEAVFTGLVFALASGRKKVRPN